MALKDNDNENAAQNRVSRRAGLNREAARHEREIARRAARDQATYEPEDEFTPPLFSLSGIRNGLVHSTISKAIMLLLIFIFAVGFLLLSNNQPGNLPTGGQGGNKADAPAVVATAAGQPISRADFDYATQQQAQMASYYGQTVDPTNLFVLQQSVLTQLAGRAALIKAAQDAGIGADDSEISARIEKEITDRIAQENGGNAAAARRMIEQQYGSEEKYRETLRGNYDREKVAQAIVAEKYQKQWQEKNQPSEAAYLKSLTKLNLSLILTRPQLPPRSEKNQGAAFEKNKADAKARIEKIATQLKGLQGVALVTKFSALAKTSSDDIATKAKGGIVGFKAPAEMPMGEEAKAVVQDVKTFPAVIGPIEDKEMSVWSLYLVNGRKVEMPKDYAKNKDKLLKAFQEQTAQSAWQKYTQDLSKTTEVQLSDPALDAFKAQNGALLVSSTGTAQQDILNKYDEALKFASGDEAAAIHYQRAQIFQSMKQPDKYVAELRASVEAARNSLPVRLELARALKTAKDSKGAIEQLQAASKSLDDTPAARSLFGGNPNDALRAQIASEFLAVGRKDLAAAERKKIVPTRAGGNTMNSNNVITIPSGALPSGAKR